MQLIASAAAGYPEGGLRAVGPTWSAASFRKHYWLAG
jgi:hypothetical protein